MTRLQWAAEKQEPCWEREDEVCRYRMGLDFILRERGGMDGLR